MIRSPGDKRQLLSPADPVPITPGNPPIAIEHVVSVLTSMNLVVGAKGCAAPLDPAETMTVYSIVAGSGNMLTESL